MKKEITLNVCEPLTLSNINRILLNLTKQIIPQEQCHYVIDLSSASQCDSAGLAGIIELLRKMKKNQNTVVFKGVPQQMQLLADFCGVDSLLLKELEV